MHFATLRERLDLEERHGPGECESCLHRHLEPTDEPCCECTAGEGERVPCGWTSCRLAAAAAEIAEAQLAADMVMAGKGGG